MNPLRKTNVLITLGVLFTIGGVMRVVSGTPATAEASSDPAEASVHDYGENSNTALSADPIPVSPEQVCFSEASARSIREDLDRMDTQSAILGEREIELKLWEDELKLQTTELDSLRETIETRWMALKTEAEADINHLADMYSAMKPDQAASIFDKMDPVFAAGFLRLMTSEQAGLILASMDSDKAYIVSISLANRNDDIRSSIGARAP